MMYPKRTQLHSWLFDTAVSATAVLIRSVRCKPYTYNLSMYPPSPTPLEKFKVGIKVRGTLGDDQDRPAFQVDLLLMDDYPADSCAINPMAFLLHLNVFISQNIPFTLNAFD